ncbi:MAG: hypothetical protein HYV07_10280 [Deltaproteobacteria bacterium]|nr:hypothetical protein [Deltaproteobacteria bacterium]
MKKPQLKMLLIFVAAAIVPFWLGRAYTGEAAEAEAPWSFRLVLPATAILVGLSLATYGAFVGARAFIVDFDRPVFGRLLLRNKVFVLWASLFVMFVGVRPYAVYAFTELRASGVPVDPSSGTFIGSWVMISLFHLMFYTAAPTWRRALRLRLLALGISEEEQGKGQLIGIADPKLSTWGKSSPLDDVGLLVVEPDRLLFRGDSTTFSIPLGGLSAVESSAGAMNWSPAIFGVMPLETRFSDSNGIERAVRVFPLAASIFGMRNDTAKIRSVLEDFKQRRSSAANS